MRKTTTIPTLVRHWLNGIFLALFVGLVTTPAVAILSEKTGQIQGQAPTVTGRLQVLYPDGETVVADNAILGGDQIPNQFVVSSSTTYLVLQDTDDDSGLSAWVDTDHATLSWKHDGTELTPDQLAASFGSNFAGQALTLVVSAPVTVSSVTGLPTTAVPQILTSSYTLSVPLPVLIQDDFTVTSGASADGVDSNALNAIVKDAHGNLLSGVEVTFNVISGAATPATQTVKTNESGMAQAALVSTVAGDNQVAAAVGSQSTTVKTSIFVADERTAIIDAVDFSVASGAVADGVASNALSAIVKDAHGNLLSGVDVTFNVTSGEATPTTQTVKTNDSGLAQAALVSTVVGNNQVTVTSLGSTPAAKTASFVGVTIKLTADRQTITADGSDIVTYTAEVVDTNDKPVNGVSVNWKTSINGLSHNTSLTNENGYATATLSGSQIGQARVTASVGGNSISVDVEFTDKILESWIINSTSSTHSAKPIYGVGIESVGYGFITIPPTIGPTSLSAASFDPDIVTVPLSNETGQQYMVKFRGYRSNACSVRSMSSSIACGGAIGTSTSLRLDYNVEDNGHLPAGIYDGVINLQGVGTKSNNRIDMTINVQLTVTADTSTAGLVTANGHTFSMTEGFPTTGLPGQNLR
ncbi:Ig-like domain-containing protein [Yersinia enterocolitica]|uniref:Ig-like domain-containing protein n=1 Tax=Yersinia enterocolitica TaxID=630 RepID=UPI002AC67AEC|nr:Ig-like domain-containing protein [Yersinia enterocolitica]